MIEDQVREVAPGHYIYTCCRCGYQGHTRVSYGPTKCAKCKTPYWWRPKKEKDAQ